MAYLYKPLVKNLDSDIRVDKETGFICVTDIGNLKDGSGTDHVKNWLRNGRSIDFFTAWEIEYNPQFKGVEFDPFKFRAGENSFKLSATELVEAGATGIFSRRGRSGGTFCNIDWTIHFAR